MNATVVTARTSTTARPQGSFNGERRGNSVTVWIGDGRRARTPRTADLVVAGMLTENEVATLVSHRGLAFTYAVATAAR